MSYKEQIQNSDCKCKCMERPLDRQCCFSGFTNHCEVFITDYDSIDKKNNDCCSTCFCTLLCFGPKFTFTLPFWPFTIYNCLRNTCMKTENNNYIC